MCDVLLLDDDVLLRLVMAETLQNEGFHVIHVHTPGEACAVLDREGAAVLVTDHELGAGQPTGVEFAERALHDNPALRIVYASARSDLLGGRAPRGHERVLSKPYEPFELIAAVRALMPHRHHKTGRM